LQIWRCAKIERRSGATVADLSAEAVRLMTLDIAARNLALLRKIALNLVTRDRRDRASRRGRRKMAAWNDDYMLQIITGQAHA
jgi:hypothetical protein